MSWSDLLARFGKLFQPVAQAAETESGHSRAPADVIVVGGGIAGLACARAIGQQGKRVLVLEGRDRLGGRIHTVSFQGAKVDVGASWIHGGGKRNPIRALADQAGAKLIEADYESLELYDLDGRELKNREHKTIDQVVEQTMQQLLRAKRGARPDQSLAQTVESAFENAGLSATEQRGVRWALASEISCGYAADFRNLSLSQWDEDYEYGGEDYQFAGGSSVLVDFLANECRRLGAQFQTGAVVKSIDWSSNAVRIQTSKENYEAMQAVVTLPLGVLKRGAVEFLGKIPDGKRRAIERLGYGTLNKVVMAFPEQFWEDEASYFGCLGETNAMPIDYWNLEQVTGKPVLAALVGGDAAVKLEGMSDGEIRRIVLEPLRRTFDDDVEEPRDLLVTRWASDPFSYGAYSHVRPGATYDDYETLAQPIGNRLFFAGEATSARYPSTLHGAFESGERAAKEVMR